MMKLGNSWTVPSRLAGGILFTNGFLTFGKTAAPGTGSLPPLPVAELMVAPPILTQP